MHISTPVFAAVALAALLGLTGCGPDSARTDDGTAQSSSSASAGSTVDATGLAFDNAWVKSQEDGMTAVFGTLHNRTEKDITVLSADFAGAEMTELHETVDDGSGTTTMQEKSGGFVVPAGGSLSFVPGGDHIMLMGLIAAIEPGQEISVDLRTTDARSFTLTAIAKDYAGAKETYVPKSEDGGHTEHDHGEHRHGAD